MYFDNKLLQLIGLIAAFSSPCFSQLHRSSRLLLFFLSPSFSSNEKKEKLNLIERKDRSRGFRIDRSLERRESGFLEGVNESQWVVSQRPVKREKKRVCASVFHRVGDLKKEATPVVCGVVVVAWTTVAATSYLEERNWKLKGRGWRKVTSPRLIIRDCLRRLLNEEEEGREGFPRLLDRIGRDEIRAKVFYYTRYIFKSQLYIQQLIKFVRARWKRAGRAIYIERRDVQSFEDVSSLHLQLQRNKAARNTEERGKRERRSDSKKAGHPSSLPPKKRGKKRKRERSGPFKLAIFEWTSHECSLRSSYAVNQWCEPRHQCNKLPRFRKEAQYR